MKATTHFLLFQLFLVLVIGGVLSTEATPVMRRSNFIGGIGMSVGSGRPPFPYPTPAPSPPTYNFSSTATVVFTGVDVQTDNISMTNDFRNDTEIIFSYPRLCTVYPNNTPGSFVVMNASKVLSSGAFINFTYYNMPLAEFTAIDYPNRTYSIAAQLNPPGIIKFASNALRLKQVVAVSRPDDFYVAWRAVNPFNTSARPQLKNGFLDFGVMSVLKVPCVGAGIDCS